MSQFISKQRILSLAFVFFTIHQIAYGQNNRLNTNNNIGWYNYFGTFKFSERFGLHSEYQWRRNNFITNGQQSLLRFGLNYVVNPRVLFRVGYAWVETFPYGDYPINGYGKDFTEHRFFEMMQLSHKEGKIDFSHRFMLEQRFVGKYSSAKETKEKEYPLLNRFRYMFRVQVPLKSGEMKDKTPYLAFYDEVFIGFGKHVNVNVFDQNRIGLLLGYRWNKNIRLEAGYLNQTVQLGRQIAGQNVFQYNNGIIVNANFNFDLIKK